MSPPGGQEEYHQDRLSTCLWPIEMWLSGNVLLFFWPFSLLLTSFLTDDNNLMKEGGQSSPDFIRIVYWLIRNPGTRSLWLRQTRKSPWPDVCCCCEHWWDAAINSHIWAFNESPSLIHFLPLYWNIWAESQIMIYCCSAPFGARQNKTAPGPPRQFLLNIFKPPEQRTINRRSKCGVSSEPPSELQQVRLQICRPGDQFLNFYQPVCGYNTLLMMYCTHRSIFADIMRLSRFFFLLINDAFAAHDNQRYQTKEEMGKKWQEEMWEEREEWKSFCSRKWWRDNKENEWEEQRRSEFTSCLYRQPI